MRIGWFFNAHGAGHRNRLSALLPHFTETVQLTTLSYAAAGLNRDSIPHITLPAYNQPNRCSSDRNQVWKAMHGLQMNAGKNAAFFSRLTAWIEHWQPQLMVVDVALEAALMARLCGIPVIYMRQHGQRWDFGHRLAYEASISLLAPFAAQMEQADCPAWIRKKTFYAGGFCRFSQMRPSPPEQFLASGCNVVVMIGAGGTNLTADAIATAAAATPQWRWFILGLLHQPIHGQNIRLLGHVPDVYPYLCHASLVIANAGHNTVMEIGLARSPFLCLPAQRPFKEQLCKAAVLEKLNLAVVRHRWPQPDEWPLILQVAQQQNKRPWQSLISSTAPQQAARFVEGLAHRYEATAV